MGRFFTVWATSEVWAISGGGGGLVAKSCPTPGTPDCSLSGFSVHGTIRKQIYTHIPIHTDWVATYQVKAWVQISFTRFWNGWPTVRPSFLYLLLQAERNLWKEILGWNAPDMEIMFVFRGTLCVCVYLCVFMCVIIKFNVNRYIFWVSSQCSSLWEIKSSLVQLSKNTVYVLRDLIVSKRIRWVVDKHRGSEVCRCSCCVEPCRSLPRPVSRRPRQMRAAHEGVSLGLVTVTKFGVQTTVIGALILITDANPFKKQDTIVYFKSAISFLRLKLKIAQMRNGGKSNSQTPLVCGDSCKIRISDRSTSWPQCQQGDSDRGTRRILTCCTSVQVNTWTVIVPEEFIFSGLKDIF